MKLNPDCVRDILMLVEDKSTFSEHVTAKEFGNAGLFSNYGQEQLLYHIRLCYESNLITNVKFYMSGFSIEDLSPAGHNFVNDIRNDTNWNRTKTTAKKVGSFSIDVLTNIASSVISNVIKDQLHQT